MNIYSDLTPFSSVPTEVYKALEIWWNKRGPSSSDAKLQLGLCLVSGFGAKSNLLKGLAMIHEAAVDGSQHARMIVSRFHRALGVPTSAPLRELYASWLSELAHTGSRMVVQELGILLSETSSHQWHWPSIPHGCWSQRLNALCDTISKGQRPRILPQDSSVGPNGDSMLHWCVFLPPKFGTRIATLLMNHGCSPAAVTSVQCPLADSMDTEPYCNVMPARTTPVDWAIIEDNIEVLKTLLKPDQMGHTNSIESPIFTPITCAAHYQRLECLSYILDSTRDTIRCDNHNQSPLFHVIHTNIFTSILQFYNHAIPVHAEREQPQTLHCPPVIQAEIQVIELLQTHRVSRTACRQPDFNYLHLAIASKNSQVLGHLLKTEDLRGHVNQIVKGEWSPLSYAVSLGDEAAIDLLLSYGANVDQVSSQRRFNALHICALFPRFNSAEIASKLIVRSRRLVNSRSKSGYTALHLAAIAGNVPLMNTLVANGAHLTAASNLITPLGLAVAYWSELGVEEMCKIHRKLRIPYMAAYYRHRLYGSWPASQAAGPLALILAPGSDSAMKRVRELPVAYDGGCYDPPISGPAEAILRILLQYPGSGSVLEYLRVWYYQTTEQFSSRDIKRRNLFIRCRHIIVLLIRFVIGLMVFLLYEVDEVFDSLAWAIEMRDHRAVEILLEEPHRKKVSQNMRYLVLCCQSNYWPSQQQKTRDSLTKIENLLTHRQIQFFSQRKSQRTHGALQYFWKPFYHFYWNLEQHEYERYNNLFGYRKLDTSHLTVEFHSYYIHTRMAIYPVLGAILWAILGPMLYHLTMFARSLDQAISTSNLAWTIALVIIVRSSHR